MSVVVVSMVSGLSAPMFAVYRSQFGISAADVSAALVAYLVSLIVCLGPCGRLADSLGRRKVAVPGLVGGAVASLVLSQVDSVTPLVVGRALQGASSGVALAALGALAIDLSARRFAAVGVGVVSISPAVGSAAGALISGVALPRLVNPTVTIYLCAALALGVCALAVALVEEDRAARPKVASAWPTLAVPRRVAVAFVPAALAAAAAYNLGGLSQALSPAIVTEHFGSPSSLVAAISVAAAQITSPAAAMAHRWRSRAALSAGCIVLLLSVAAIAGAIVFDCLTAYVVASATGGLGFGLALAGGTRLLIDRCHPHERAATLALLYMVAYTSSAVPILIVALVVDSVGLVGVCFAYCVVIAAAAGASATLAVRRRL